MIDTNDIFIKDWELKFGILNKNTNTLVQDFPDPDFLMFDTHRDAYYDPVMWNKEIYKVVQVKRTYVKTIYEYEVISE